MDLEVPEGVKAFNFWTILIMARLWEEFPRPQYFQMMPHKICVTSDYNVQGTPIGPEGQEQAQLLTATMQWLLDEEFVRGVAGVGGGFANVSLTPRGFSVLSEVPTSVAIQPEAAARKSLADLFREGAASQAVDKFGALIQVMLTTPWLAN